MNTALRTLACMLIGVAVVCAQDSAILTLKKADLPIYPLLARQARIQGTVKISFDVSQDGTVSNVQGISGHALLKSAAIENVSTWKFAGGLNKQQLETEFVYRLSGSVGRNPRLTVSLESFRQIDVTSDFIQIDEEEIIRRHD